MMKKKRRLVRQDNAGKAGKKIKGHFREIQEEMINEKILEAKKKRELELKGNSYNSSSSSPDGVEGLPGHIPFSSGLPVVEGLLEAEPRSLPQTMADDAFDSVQKAKENNYGLFRGDVKETMQATASMLKDMIIDFQREVTELILKKNDPKWADLGIEKKARIYARVSESLVKINNVELSWAKPESKKGQPQVHLHYNIPDDPLERTRLLVEYDNILGRMPVIPTPLLGQQQRILIETKPYKEDKEESLRIGSGKEE